MSSSRISQYGFTLVELAIVLMVIGLLIGGILRGQEIAETARIAATIQQTRAYDGAATTFRDAYGQIAGDMVRPELRVPNCATIPGCATPSGTAGAGNGVLGTILMNPYSTALAYDTGQGTENAKFWLQLSLAGLISGVDASGQGGERWGGMFPMAKLGGGFHTVYIRYTNPVWPFDGQYLILRNNPVSGTHAMERENSVMTPRMAARFDRKIDDGWPQTGDVIGLAGDWCGAPSSGTTYAYRETSDVRQCNLMIAVQN